MFCAGRHSTRAVGYREGMASPEYRKGPSPDEPLNAPGPRPEVTPVLFVLLLLAVIAVIFLAMFLIPSSSS